VDFDGFVPDSFAGWVASLFNPVRLPDLSVAPSVGLPTLDFDDNLSTVALDVVVLPIIHCFTARIPGCIPKNASFSRYTVLSI